MPKVIILRGNSGSGKSTIANELVKTIKHKTVIIEQDYFRSKMFFPIGESWKEVRELMLQNIIYSLDHDYDVLWVSIFHKQVIEDYFKSFFKNLHPKDNFIFNFETSLEETFKGHKTRVQKDEFSEEDMREWYKPIEKFGYDFEYSIPESSTLNQTSDFIRKTSSI